MEQQDVGVNTVKSWRQSGEGRLLRLIYREQRLSAVYWAAMQTFDLAKACRLRSLVNRLRLRINLLSENKLPGARSYQPPLTDPASGTSLFGAN